MRRRFYELAAAGPAPIASEALERIGAIYAVESEIRGLAPDQRRAARQAASAPLVEALGAFLRTQLDRISGKTRLAERSAMPSHAGTVSPASSMTGASSSTPTSSSARSGQLALTRKNALFAGSDGGGEHWAVVASLVEACKLNGVDPHAYLGDVITRIVNGHPNAALDDLLPWAYVGRTLAHAA